MDQKRYVVMGAGEVGYHLAQSLSSQGHNVTVIELAEAKYVRVSDQLDVLAVHGNGAHPPVLAAARVKNCDLFMAVSSNDEANLAAALLAKNMGALRTVARVSVAEEVINYRKSYEDVFGVDLLLSTQLLTTTRILNKIRGHNTVAVEYLADGKVQLRKVMLDDNSPLTQRPLSEVGLPRDVLVVAYYRGDELIIPSGADRAQAGDEALLLGSTAQIAAAERQICSLPVTLGGVTMAGAGATAETVAQMLAPLDVPVKVIEHDRARAQELASRFPKFQIIHGDVTDLSLMKAERIHQSQTFVALTGNDESNLLASLLAQEIGVPQVLALVQRTETAQLWRRLGLEQVFSPRVLAYDRIQAYIEHGYSAHIVSLQKGAAQVIERRLISSSPAAGLKLSELKPPRGLIVAAVTRGDRVFIPHGGDRLEVDDQLTLFVHEDELGTVQSLFPGTGVV